MVEAGDSTTDSIQREMAHLRASQLAHVLAVVELLKTPVAIERSGGSDFATESLCSDFADLLLLHHASSNESFTKDKFEHAMARVLRQQGRDATLAQHGLAGPDLIVEGEKWSLKTQADVSIAPGLIHISKFMELGHGQWDVPEDLAGLRDQMLAHMNGYDRIFTLRCLSNSRRWPVPNERAYELVEIPKTLLELCATGTFEMMMESRQQPRPGYCRVLDAQLGLLFELYFDGGTERKLQVRKLRKDQCKVHAVWRFTPKVL